MTQTELGAFINVTYQQIQKYERGRSQIAASMLVKIAEAFRVPAAQLFDGLLGSTGFFEICSEAEVEASELLKAFARMNRQMRRAAIRVLQVLQ